MNKDADSTRDEATYNRLLRAETQLSEAYAYKCQQTSSSLIPTISERQHLSRAWAEWRAARQARSEHLQTDSTKHTTTHWTPTR